MRVYTPIVVVYQGQRGKKYMKVYNDQRCPDRIISSRSNIFDHKKYEILDLGVGKNFIDLYKKKHKL